MVFTGDRERYNGRMEWKRTVETREDEEQTTDVTLRCPVCKSQMFPSNGVKVICIACGFEEMPSD